MKIKAKQLTYEDFGNRILHTDRFGTETSRVITGVKHWLPQSRLVNRYDPESGKESQLIRSPFLHSTIYFLDGTSMKLAGDNEVELDEVTKPVEFSVDNPYQTGLR